MAEVAEELSPVELGQGLEEGAQGDELDAEEVDESGVEGAGLEKGIGVVHERQCLTRFPGLLERTRIPAAASFRREISNLARNSAKCRARGSWRSDRGIPAAHRFTEGESHGNPVNTAVSLRPNWPEVRGTDGHRKGRWYGRAWTSDRRRPATFRRFAISSGPAPSPPTTWTGRAPQRFLVAREGGRPRGLHRARGPRGGRAAPVLRRGAAALRRRGVGAALHDAAVALARALGIRDLYILTTTVRERALRTGSRTWRGRASRRPSARGASSRGCARPRRRA